jgi:predicted O-linked N-acetylglucosamine transferase (SPINDLY family)
MIKRRIRVRIKRKKEKKKLYPIFNYQFTTKLEEAHWQMRWGRREKK